MPVVEMITAGQSVQVSTGKLVGPEIAITTYDAARVIAEVESSTTTLYLADASRLTLVGRTTVLSMRGTDAARLIAPEFTAAQASVALSDVFRATTQVTQSIYGTAQDVSRFVYEGTAVNRVQTRDVARVEKAENAE